MKRSESQQAYLWLTIIDAGRIMDRGDVVACWETWTVEGIKFRSLGKAQKSKHQRCQALNSLH